ncbi:site-specific DNA-methyltransferase [Neorhizobium galegae]|uniref:site-specific DNA-methyltransferase n=1 Tax=Neorhizobium galegae TaxID=399 RepID=UPI001F1A3DEA|nr:site-specific DNA-methyltransferase [Neorhizobium galegae]UIK06205.1 site-specific DNA-methyltransferase [Neorhizobium galegae]
MEKLKMHSLDLSQDNITKIRDLFPGCVTEARDEATGQLRLAVDFDQLRQELSDSIVEGPQERYRLDWPGKREALLLANAPVAKTLIPDYQGSLKFDETGNLFINGDNLEALKLLQATFLGKVKMIYIDPPYNTGSDFIYNDDFSESSEEYLVKSNQKMDGGIRLVANTEANGRFHSDWLTMIYPRIKLARNLLSDDGVIFVSISDEESANIRRLLDEVFGEQNFIETIAVEMSTTSGPKTVNAQQGTIVKNVEFVHVFRKTAEFDKIRHTPLLDGIASFDTHYTVWMNEDGTLSTLADKMMDDALVGADIQRYGFGSRNNFSINNIDRLLAVSDAAKAFIDKNLGKIARVDRPPVSTAGQSTEVGRWKAYEADHRTYFLTTLANGSLQALMPLSLNYRMSDDYKPRFGRTVIRGDLWKGFHQDMGNVAKEGDIAFSNGKKPVRLIKQLMKWANNTKHGIVLDFFAGSGTTAHAVLEANAEDGFNRKFILVQLDEVPDQKSDAAKEGYKSIAALSAERVRRAGKKILESDCHPDWNRDVGFRMLNVDTSNMKDVYYRPDQLKQSDLLDMVDNVKEGRTAEDLLFQVLVDWGVDLTLPIRRETLQGKTVFFVDDNALVACFDKGVSEDLVKELAKHEPLRVVFRDSGFISDAVKINVEQIFRQLSPTTDIKAI